LPHSAEGSSKLLILMTLKVHVVNDKDVTGPENRHRAT